MRVLVPYTARHLDTLAGAPENAEWVDVSDSPTSYWETLCDFWDTGDDLMVIEHDVVCRQDVLTGFEACQESWCLHKYEDMCHDACMEAWRNALGCTRFRKELQAAVPDAVSSIQAPHRDWRNLCDGIGANVRAGGASHHWHEPAVVHHHMSLAHLRV